MTDILLELIYQYDIDEIKNYLHKQKIECSEDDKENRILFLNYVLTKYKDKIKKRARIRKKLSKLI